MSRSSIYLAACSAALLTAIPAPAANVTFNMVPSAAGAVCVPNAKAHVVITPGGQADRMTVKVSGLPANTGFDLFIIQVPTAPFGFSWYQGDIDTDATGVGKATFLGRFSIETTVIDPNTAPAPVVFPTDANANPAPLDTTLPSIQTYHVGLWFDSPRAAVKAGCPNTVTPFNGAHHAGVQALNTSNFPADSGPLRNVQ